MNYPFLMIAVGLFLVSCQQKKMENPPDERTLPIDSLQIDSVTQLIRKNPTDAGLFADRAQLYIKTGNLSKAMDDLLLANHLDSLNPLFYNQLADYYLQLGKSEAVDRILQKGNQLIPNNRDILYRLGNLYFYIQDYKKAITYLNQSQQADPQYGPTYFTKGMVFLETGDTAKAITSFQVAVEREPDYYDAYMQLGLLFGKRLNPIAIDYYQNALRIIPNSYEALYAKAMFYQQTEKIEEAIKAYRYLLDEVSEEFPAVHYNLGYIDMVFYGEYNQAISHFDSALMFKPNYPEALYNKGFCFEKSGNTPEARAYFMRALEQRPNFDLAIKGLNRLDKK